MTTHACPRCGRSLLTPTLMRAEFACTTHGSTVGLGPATQLTSVALAHLAKSDTPIWVLWPMPPLWRSSGVRWAARPDGRVVAGVTAFSGPGLSDGPHDLLLVAEEPGAGLVTGLVGWDVEPAAAASLSRKPDAHVRLSGRDLPMWALPAPSAGAGEGAAPRGPDVVAVGEAHGVWLWLIGWPDGVWFTVQEGLQLVDARSLRVGSLPASGALSPRLTLPGEQL